ncbi:MAG: hypothetical protein KC800_03530 [Candidatus Eremiobacteraeota bacterium]|nr:hypothetical protein [Candidatus Eremiobacteraeota bacterium]
MKLWILGIAASVTAFLFSWRKRRTQARRALGPPAPESTASALDWHEHKLTNLAYSVGGLSLGMTQKEAGLKIPGGAKRGEQTWSWGPHGLNTVRFVEGRVREVWGDRLEVNGEVILKRGGSVGSLDCLRAWGDPSRREVAVEDYHIFTSAPFVIISSVLNESAALSLEHKILLGTEDVKDKVFRVALGFLEDEPGRTAHI